MTDFKNRKINAISAEFPFIATYSNKMQERRPASPCCVKQFNDQRFGNNREAPSYMQLPSLQPNSKTYLNTFIEKSLEIENKIKNHESIVKSEELSTENLRKLGRFVHKPGNSLSKSIDKNTSPERVFYEKLNISPKYLKNLNDYNISESFAVNTDRQIQFEKKVSKRFDCLTDQIKEIKPPTLSVDKWSKFYENYLTMSDKGSGFKFQKGYFTDFADHQKMTLDLKKFIFMDNLNKEKNTSSSGTFATNNTQSTKKQNKRYHSLAKERLEQSKKKTLEVVNKNKLFKLKSYLIKNGVLD